MADSKTTALPELSVPALEDLIKLVDDPGGTPVSVKATIQRVFGFPLRATADGRLTTQSGVAISTSDRTAQSTIYYTPFIGTRIALYDGTRWALYTFAEVSLALSGLTSGKNYDVFVYDNAGTLTLELSAAWTNDTTRADALTTQDGVYVKSGATTRRWLGTIRTTSTTTTEDSLAKRFVWNATNRVDRKAFYDHGTATHTYDSTTIRQFDNSTAAQVEFVMGMAGLSAAFGASARITTDTASQATILGLGENSTTTYITGAVFDVFAPAGVSARVGTSTSIECRLGYSAISLNQSSSATGTHSYAAGRMWGHLTC